MPCSWLVLLVCSCSIGEVVRGFAAVALRCGLRDGLGVVVWCGKFGGLDNLRLATGSGKNYVGPIAGAHRGGRSGVKGLGRLLPLFE